MRRESRQEGVMGSEPENPYSLEVRLRQLNARIAYLKAAVARTGEVDPRADPGRLTELGWLIAERDALLEKRAYLIEARRRLDQDGKAFDPADALRWMKARAVYCPPPEPPPPPQEEPLPSAARYPYFVADFERDVAEYLARMRN
jgi:hypothetical protein